MAEKKASTAINGAPTSEADKTRARSWFKKADECRDRHDYDYAVECFITGLGYWPEAVEEGHMPLSSLALQRQQAGGKKPGLLDGMRKSMTGKDPRLAMLNAEHLLALDPQNSTYAEGLLKNAVRGGYLETARWAAPRVLDLLKREKKPNKSKFLAFRDALVQGADLAVQRGEHPMETWLLEQAMHGMDYLVIRSQGDDGLRNEVRDLAGRLTIARGKYEQSDSFRESLQDAESQKLLHDSERMRQGEGTLDALIEAVRKDYEANPTVGAKLNAYIDALLKAERDDRDGQAVEVLLAAYGPSRNYSLKSRADDVRLRVLKRRVDALVAAARESGGADDKQQARLAANEFRSLTLDIYRERVEQYPTDLRLKYLLARALFDAGGYDEAIPLLQAAQQDPRVRARCQVMLGRAFLEKGGAAQAVEVLREAIEKYDMVDDISKNMLYWLARSFEAVHNIEEAKTAYGKLLRQEYNYLDGDARKRLDALNAAKI